MRTDDELYTGESRFYGPPGHTLIWPLRYTALGVGLAFFIVLAAVEGVAGIPASPVQALSTVVCAWACSRQVMKTVTPNRPVRTLPGLYWAEASAPRPGRTGRALRVSLAGLRWYPEARSGSPAPTTPEAAPAAPPSPPPCSPAPVTAPSRRRSGLEQALARYDRAGAAATAEEPA